GFLVLSELPDARTLWLMATGTGIAPFVSMLRAGTPWQRFENVVLVHAVRHAQELVYRDDVERARERHGTRFRYVPIVSREDAAGRAAGRLPGAVRGRPPRRRGGPRACSGGFPGHAVRQSRHAEGHERGARRARPAQEPAPLAGSDHGGELLVRSVLKVTLV